jgi:metallo-beta-lactamase class B
MRSQIISFVALAASVAGAQTRDTVRVEYSAARCPNCADWNGPHQPTKIFGNTFYVGMSGVSAILITSPAGHVLIDGGIPMSAPRIIDHIRALGFRIEDVKLILNSHAHHDHAGGIAALQRASGAQVAASPWSAKVIGQGESDNADPQFGLVLPYPAAKSVRVLQDGETLHVGPLAVTAHFTPGHTPGGTSWTWESCENGRCLELLYADSQTAVSADDFLFTKSRTYPNGVRDFQRGLSTLESLECDVLLTPHPGASQLFERLAARDSGKAGLEDPAQCKRFVAAARKAVDARFAREAASKP